MFVASMKRLRPSDSLWLALLEQEPKLKSAPPDKARRILEKAGFPPHVIDAYLSARKADTRSKAANG